MKNILVLFLILCLSNAYAQDFLTKKTDNVYDLPASKTVDLDLKFAKIITVRTWDKAQLGLKSKVTTNSEEVMKWHQIEVTESSRQLSIVADYEEQSNRSKYDCFTNCNKENLSWNGKECACITIEFEVMLPADANLFLETINGDVEIRDFTGRLHVKSINGFVDVDWEEQRAADLYFHTIHGEIYTDFELKSTLKDEMFPKVKVAWKGGGEQMELETINGNIYFRKTK